MVKSNKAVNSDDITVLKKGSNVHKIVNIVQNSFSLDVNELEEYNTRDIRKAVIVINEFISRGEWKLDDNTSAFFAYASSIPIKPRRNTFRIAHGSFGDVSTNYYILINGKVSAVYSFNSETDQLVELATHSEILKAYSKIYRQNKNALKIKFELTSTELSVFDVFIQRNVIQDLLIKTSK